MYSTECIYYIVTMRWNLILFWSDLNTHTRIHMHMQTYRYIYYDVMSPVIG